MERLLEHLPKVVLRGSAVDSVCHGADLAAPGMDSADRKIRKGDAVAMFSPKGEAVALGSCLVNLEEGVSKKGIVIDTKRVFMEAGTYPRMWKTREKERPV